VSRRSRTRRARSARRPVRAALLLLLAVALPGCGLRVASSEARSATVAAEGNGPAGGAGGSAGGSAAGGSGVSAGAVGAPAASTAGAGYTAPGASSGGTGSAGTAAGSSGAAGAAGTAGSAARKGTAGAPGTGTRGRSTAAAGATGPAVGKAAPAGGNGGATDVGVTATSISIGNVSDLGGPVPGLFQGGPYGTQAYFDYINSQGGIYGRKLKLVTADDGLQCSQNESAYQSLVSQVFAFAGSWSLDDNCGAQILQSHPTIPIVNQALSPQFASLPGEFSEAPFGQGATLGPFEYYKSKYPDAITSVGTLVGNQPSAVAAWGYSKKAMESLGYKVIYEDDFPPAQSNFTADVVRMHAAGVKMVYLIALNAPDAADFAMEAAQQGFHPEIFACAVCYYGGYVQSAGGASAVNGQYLNVGAEMFLGEDASSVPEIATYQHWLKEAYPSYVPDQFSAYSWADAALLVKALEAVGPHLTRQAVVAALAGIHNFNDNGLMAPADTGAKKPSSCYLILQIQNGKYVKVDDPPTGFRCDAPYYNAG
jgi:ABC-type branched-subunit amino acid transport system substrate-binding protein